MKLAWLVRNDRMRSEVAHETLDRQALSRYFEQNKLGFRTLLPFLHNWTRVPRNYEEIYQQMLSEMQQPDFVATWNLLTAWGHPQQKRSETN